jgi:hypothetical protein
VIAQIDGYAASIAAAVEEQAATTRDIARNATEVSGAVSQVVEELAVGREDLAMVVSCFRVRVRRVNPAPTANRRRIPPACKRPDDFSPARGQKPSAPADA